MGNGFISDLQQTNKSSNVVNSPFNGVVKVVLSGGSNSSSISSK